MQDLDESLNQNSALGTLNPTTVGQDKTHFTLPSKWDEVVSCKESGLHIFTKTEVSTEFPFVSHPMMCKVVFPLCQIEFYVNGKKCPGPNIEGLWEHHHHISSVISVFDKMFMCPGVKDDKLNALQKVPVPTGSFKDGVWRSHKFVPSCVCII